MVFQPTNACGFSLTATLNDAGFLTITDTFFSLITQNIQVSSPGTNGKNIICSMCIYLTIFI
jgi:hypothetical protein